MLAVPGLPWQLRLHGLRRAPRKVYAVLRGLLWLPSLLSCNFDGKTSGTETLRGLAR